MGSGGWSSSTFVSYTASTKHATLNFDGSIDTKMSNQEMFKSRNVDPGLNPYKVTRECKDSEEHPYTIPVILALDVTGSMGQAAVEVAKGLNVIMESLYKDVKDIEFMIMGIGDLYCDSGPIQISQFESDIRIAEWLDKVWFEFGGGGNFWESYTAAWYMGSRHTSLDCLSRGKKGIIITIGDERINPSLGASDLNRVTGDTLQGDVKTSDLYDEVCEKFDVYHIHVDHDDRSFDRRNINMSWSFLEDNYRVCNLNNINETIISIIKDSATNVTVSTNTNEISW